MYNGYTKMFKNKIFDNKIIKMCPARMFAINRTDKVIGRINLLTNSIIESNKINIIGQPIGIKWISKFFKFFITVNIITVVHIINAILIIILIWDVKVKLYDKIDIKFSKKIIIIKEILILISILLNFFIKFILIFINNPNTVLNILFLIVNFWLLLKDNIFTNKIELLKIVSIYIFMSNLLNILIIKFLLKMLLNLFFLN